MLDLTSSLYIGNQTKYPERKLRNGDDPETNNDGNVFHRHSIYPATESSMVRTSPSTTEGFQT